MSSLTKECEKLPGVFWAKPRAWRGTGSRLGSRVTTRGHIAEVPRAD